MKETIRDIDYLVSVMSEKDGDNVIDYFIDMPEVKEVSGRGYGRISQVRSSKGSN